MAEELAVTLTWYRNRAHQQNVPSRTHQQLSFCMTSYCRDVEEDGLQSIVSHQGSLAGGEAGWSCGTREGSHLPGSFDYLSHYCVICVSKGTGKTPELYHSVGRKKGLLGQTAKTVSPCMCVCVCSQVLGEWGTVQHLLGGGMGTWICCRLAWVHCWRSLSAGHRQGK